MQEYNLSELVSEVSAKSENHKNTVSAVLSAAFSAMAEQIGAKKRIEIKGLGVFKAKERKEKSGVFQGKEWVKPAHIEIVFDPSPDFIERANSKNTSDLKIER